MMGRPSNKLRGKVAVVTGGSRGIGLIIAASLAQAGAQIVICGRDMAKLEEVYGQLSTIPGVQVLALDCDVRQPE
ncbi:MAG: SDR family NAD(P)-dependent oxidoreductase, partial [Ardenticatenaceae bacterium]